MRNLSKLAVAGMVIAPSVLLLQQRYFPHLHVTVEIGNGGKHEKDGETSGSHNGTVIND